MIKKKDFYSKLKCTKCEKRIIGGKEKVRHLFIDDENERSERWFHISCYKRVLKYANIHNDPEDKDFSF